jgi:hypothetical protein
VLTLLALYHRKKFRRSQSDYAGGTDEDQILLDVEAEVTFDVYESHHVGAMTCWGYVFEVWDYNLYFKSKPGTQTYVVFSGGLPPLSLDGVIRRLQELHYGNNQVGIDKTKDYLQLQEFIGDFR